jgi:hypothetical protein
MGLFVSRDYPFTQDGPLDTDNENRLFGTRQKARVWWEYHECGQRTRQDKAREDKEARRPIKEED